MNMKPGRFIVFWATYSIMLGDASAAEIQIEAPQGGWRDSSRERMKFTQSVNYPASVVNTQEGQSKSAMIKGRISGELKEGEDPYMLVVNGVPMPLLMNSGVFSRPYLFGRGSNGVEIRSPDGKDRARVQFYESSSGMIQPKLSVLLSWDTNQTDIDLHVISPDGQHVWYGQRVAGNGGALDVDVTTGYGPEIFSTPAPLKGTYLVYVNYYGSGPRDDLTVTQVSVITNQNTADEKKETFTVPMRRAGDLTLVHSFVIP